ncbi:MAG: hypothetical protein KDD64_15105 [Bdellovibrionales bacterium]|nr:hypothetical protein [Bdellovibrionales bacterium]
MQSSRWLTFGFCNSVSDSLLHLFPSSVTATAPYPITTKFRMFHGGEQSRIVTVEGMRLGQPDGVRLSDLFSSLREGSVGPIGVEVSFHTLQPRLELGGSRCVVEIASRSASSRFSAAYPLRFAGFDPLKSYGRVVLKDALTKSSVVLLNGTPDTIEASVLPSVRAPSQNVSGQNDTETSHLEVLPFFVEQVGPFSAVEIPFPDDIFQKMRATECSWGLVRGASVEVSLKRSAINDSARSKISKRTEIEGSMCGSFLVHRDANTHVPMSIIPADYPLSVLEPVKDAEQEGEGEPEDQLEEDVG